MDILGDYPGLPGLFVAGVFSAALRYFRFSFYNILIIIQIQSVVHYQLALTLCQP